MKARFNKVALQQAIGLVASVVPSRTAKPILRSLKLSCGKELTTLSATDLEVGINYRITQAEVEKEGTVVLPADRISAIVRESLDETILIEASEATCHISGEDSRFTIYGYEADQFPAVAGFDGVKGVSISLRQLQGCIERCLFAAARESTRYAINGVLWEMKGKRLFLVATDGRRLAKSKAEMDTAVGEDIAGNRTIVPAKTMALLERIASGSEDDKVCCGFKDNQIVVQCENVVISSVLVEGNFPKYEDIIPEDYDKKLTLSTQMVASAVRRAALLVTEESKGIRLSLDKNKLVFSSRSPETGDAQVDMAIQYKGEPVEIGFNPQFLLDVLKVIKADEFELSLGQPDRPGLIKSGTELLYLVMPVNLG